MESKNLSVKEKMLISAIIKEYWNRLNPLIQKQKSSILGNNPLLTNIVDKDLNKVNNWINLEIASMGLNSDMVDLAVFSNYAWKELDSEKKKEFVQKIKIFFFEKDSIIFGNGNSLVKPTSDLAWQAIFNHLNS